MALAESNTGQWFEQSADRYVVGNVKSGNYPKAALGAVAFAGSAFFEGPDAVIADIAGQDLKPLAPVPLARLRRDIPQFLSDVFHFRILSIAADVLRAPGSVVMDGVDLVGTFYDGGHHSFGTSNTANTQYTIRNDIDQLLAFEESYAIAA